MPCKMKTGAMLRFVFPVPVAVIAAACVLSAAAGEDDQEVKGYSRNVKKMGDSLGSGLGARGKGLGVGKGIQRSKYKYSDRSMSGGRSGSGGSLKAMHEAAFERSEDAGSAVESRESIVVTNLPLVVTRP
ncbi:MAG: hypothetical protein FJ224_10590 [Lentisphaerae bacterium]|nr:hypothetical protein [Lentisphaerota bacterium]